MLQNINLKKLYAYYLMIIIIVLNDEDELECGAVYGLNYFKIMAQ